MNPKVEELISKKKEEIKNQTLKKKTATSEKNRTCVRRTDYTVSR